MPSRKEPIAIIGTGCRFPGGSTCPSKLWELLYAPRDLTREVPSDSRFNPKGFYNVDGEHHGASNATQAYFIEEDPRYFDAGFFSIAPREAESIDPQQRILLETVYEAMENAGLTLNGMRGSATSAYMGAMSADYTDTQLRDIENVSKYMITGTSRALLANRLSYFFDWKGPSISVDTACSSSLAAVHLGVQALRAGECTTSCVGGSNIILNPDCYLAATSLHLLSPTGRSQMWDQAADGYARGEGVCVFFMKTVSQALRDGNRIDAVIREICVNSDGRTQGIALPSAEAQISLMRTAYSNAGLDLSKPEDRPQCIEAHGTGTQAGDPREALAIATTFFPPEEDHSHRPKLVVGSVKTVIGHTEGCAGIAGILKAVLAMRHRTIPPNLHFCNLNPSVKPPFEHLMIATSPMAWPEVPPGAPLRSSVNGFGSGGTNCHAIVESYVPDVHGRQANPTSYFNGNSSAEEGACPIPLVFSAGSGTALRAMLESYEKYLQRSEVSILRLAMTLNSHRSTLAVRISILAPSKADAVKAIRGHLGKAGASPSAEIGTRSVVPELDAAKGPKILGVFTGQGAQWAGMGQALLKHSLTFKEAIQRMEDAMAQLPDGPSWSLREEIMKPPSTSRLGEAEISLPICAALQVGLVKVLQTAGIRFSMVVGHSGGEIGCAYAAGKINEVDAIKIAYYRGVYTKLAIGENGKKGGMIAVGFGYQEGLNFCALRQFANRLTVAASNSPKSVTLSGDNDAVQEAKDLLDAEGVFNRVLRLDTAYHSPHMYPCAAPYLAAIERCGLCAGESNGTAWASSVYSDNRMITAKQDQDMAAAYWKDNLIGRVLFSQAVERAIDEHSGDFDLALEVGPHPSLRGPTLETIRHKLGADIPYSGVLDRKSDDISAMSAALGFIWATLGSGVVDFAAYASTFDLANASCLNAPALPDLPTYPWDHKKVLYRESRLNRNVRNRADPPHPLLGSRTPDDTEYEPRWRNFLILDELPWLRDHRIETQIIVPAATYCVMALEAARVLCRGRQVESIELCNVAILRPIVLDEASDGTETLFSVRSDLDHRKNENEIQAEFSLSAGAMDDRYLRTAATGHIRIILSSAPVRFPNRRPDADSDLLPSSIDRFYTSMAGLGLSYSGPFRAMNSLRRRLNIASATVAVDASLADTGPIHPTWLDACFQTFLAAFAAPLDNALWTTFLPTAIGKIVFASTQDSQRPGSQVTVDAHITEFVPGYKADLPTLTGDMDIFNADTGIVARIEDFVLSSLVPASETNDRRFYLKNVWEQELLSGALCASLDHNVAELGNDSHTIDACEGAVQYYLTKLKADGHLDRLSATCPGVRALLSEMESHVGSCPTDSDIAAMMKDAGDQIDLVLLRTVGESLLGLPVDDSTPMALQPPPPSMRALISRWHREGLGFSQLQKHFVNAAKQISHQYANLRILQIGPSSPGLVRSVCNELGRGLQSYTVADNAEHSLEEMKAELAVDQLRATFGQANVENGIDEANHLVSAGLFDLVVVHKAFTKQRTALKTIRGLLRPGGFMLMMAATGRLLRFPFLLLSTLPALDQDGLTEVQLMSTTRQQTHNLLREAGFSGVDSIALDNVPDKHTFSVVVSQAVDDHIRFLRSPLRCPSPIPLRGSLLILGGFSRDIAMLAASVHSVLSTTWQGQIHIVRTLAELDDEASSAEAVLSLADLDRPILDDMRAATFRGLQELLSTAKTMLWVTHRARTDNPYHNATIGLGRSFRSENPQKQLQFLDLDTLDSVQSVLAERFLAFIGADRMNDDGYMWAVEPELSLERGKIFVPRLFPDTTRNDRLNAMRRKVERQSTIGSQAAVLTRAMQLDGNVVYTAEADHSQVYGRDDTVDAATLHVNLCSTDPALITSASNHLYLCLGRTSEGTRVWGLASSNASFVRVPLAWTARTAENEAQSDGALMIELLSNIKSIVIANSIPSRYTTLVYNADAHLAASLRRLGRSDILLVSTVANEQSDICIEAHCSRREVQAWLPTTTRMLIDLGRGTDRHEFSNLAQALPTCATVASFDDLAGARAMDAGDILAKAVTDVQRLSVTNAKLDNGDVVKAADLVSGESKSHHRAILTDWTAPQRITVVQRPIDTRSLFSNQKTYILVGLTGQIGQSICRWMVQNGARHIVLTSRHPERQSQTWKKALVKEGASIVIEAADVTNRIHMAQLRTRIVDSMPPIGGIANGAMVLDDRLFLDMSLDSFQAAMKPKVEGSIILEQVFSEDALDFFLFFSSVSVITGQRTQANYVAANNFMVAMAEQRRARGLPAAVIDIGMVVGLGVIERSQNERGVSSMENSIRQMDYMPVSETDLHHLIAEAILAGQSDESPELITGLESYKQVEGEPPFWHRDLRFSHLITDPGAAEGRATSDASAQKSLKEMLRSSSGSDEATHVMENALLEYLSSSLKLSLDTIYTQVPIIDLGIDSLVAVQIRNWIWSEGGYDLPVLKILGGYSVSQICDEVVSSLSFETSSRAPATVIESPAGPTEKLRPWHKAPKRPESPQYSAEPVTNGEHPLPNGAARHSASPAEKRPRPIPTSTPPLSLGQSRLYYLSQYVEDDCALNCTISYSISGRLDDRKLERSIQQVIQRHESLRTSFYIDETTGKLMQGVLRESPFQLRVVSCANDASPVQCEFDLLRYRLYDLERADVFAATLVSDGDNSHTLVFGYHHIIMDGVSWQIFQKDMAAFYNGVEASAALENVTAQYSEFASEQQRDLSDGTYEERLDFFRDNLREHVEPLPLFPFAKVATRRAVRRYAVQEVVTHIDANTASAIRKASKAARTTPFHFYLAAFQVLLHRLLQLEKVCIGVVDANRSSPRFASTIGFFLETIPLMLTVDPNQRFNEVLQETRSKSYAALSQTGVPIEKIFTACGVASSTTETPLFQVCFNYRMGAGETSPLRGVDMQFQRYVDAQNPFDLVATVDEMPDGTAMVTLHMQDYLYDQEGGQLLAGMYASLLEGLSTTPDSPVGSVSICQPRLEVESIRLGTGPKVNLTSPPYDTLSRIVRKWSAKLPHSTAVTDATGKTMTYLQLLERSNAIAATLMNARAGPLTRIGVLLEPCVDTIASILAVLGIGATYVPLDTRNSDSQLGDIVLESQPAIVLHHRSTAERGRRLVTRTSGRKLVTLNAIPRRTARLVQDTSAPQGVAMILYTSGSTGKPKGIPLTNANLCAPIVGVSERLALGKEVVIQQSGQGFDAAVFQTFIALANGGTVIMGDNRGDPANLAALMARESVTCTTLVVSEMQALLTHGYEKLRQCSTWRFAIVVGEMFPAHLLNGFRALNLPDLKIINAYGPTEASICSSVHEIMVHSPDTVIPIGTAIANYGTYIVDESCNAVPLGWPGQIAIAGPGVTSGYLNNPELTEAKFKTGAFLKEQFGWESLYLTGDTGRMRSDGSIVILGRVDGDDQVKIRGHRVHLTEVAQALVQAAGGVFSDGAVLLKEGNLIAYVVLSRDSDVQDHKIYFSRLIQELPIPQYVRPAMIIPLGTLPMTDRGKLDGTKLASLQLPALSVDGDLDEELTTTEARLRDVWKRILGDISSTIPIRRHSDFFSVGGNSLLLLDLKSEVLKMFGVALSVSDLFQASTLQLLAAQIDGTVQSAPIDWEEETAPDETMVGPSPHINGTNGHEWPDRKPEGLSVLLTGATGFLGVHILRQLDKLPSIAHIHCVAIRRGEYGVPRKLAVQSPKVVPHYGDLSLPHLGMKDSELADLFKQIDVVIHNGAEVSHMKHYQSLRAANLSSTKELAHRTMTRGIPFHYISTGGVARLSPAETLFETSLATFPPPADGSGGYVASKWASEVFLERLQGRFHGNVWIHRPGSITGDDVPDLDVAHSLLRFSKRLKALPDLTGSTGFLDFINVDTVSEDIAAYLAKCTERNDGQVVYHHHCGEQVIPIGDLRNYLEKSEGQSIQVLPLEEWVEMAVQNGLNEVLASFMLASRGVVRAPLLQKGAPVS
ncbi:Nonribosomal peptide synthetase 14 [Aspergillus carlsbadensis]|nr:Nonribosomal peptide synthetase 14 [Aspergillus carlsbadensis]